MPGGEGVFLACSFWLADNLALMGRGAEARALFERLLGFCNDLGLIAGQVRGLLDKRDGFCGADESVGVLIWA
jgi:GH15 family glucan-1,4-alpha-glucosidase